MKEDYSSPGAHATSSAFRHQRRIRFSDCDPAGIVFYPQYFVMLNALVEDWFGDALGVGWRELVEERRIGLPTVRIEADFKAVSRMGDDVMLSLAVKRLGHYSLTLELACHSAPGGELRMQMRQVIVTTSLVTHQATLIPDDVRAAIERGAMPSQARI